MAQKDFEEKEITTKVKEVKTDRTSKNNTPYAAIITEKYPNEWFFVWESSYKDDLDQFPEIFKDSKVTIIYKDKEEDKGEHFFNVQQFWLESQEKNKKILKLKQKKSPLKQ